MQCNVKIMSRTYMFHCKIDIDTDDVSISDCSFLYLELHVPEVLVS